MSTNNSSSGLHSGGNGSMPPSISQMPSGGAQKKIVGKIISNEKPEEDQYILNEEEGRSKAFVDNNHVERSRSKSQYSNQEDKEEISPGPNVSTEKLTWGTLLVHLGKGLSWFLLTGVGIFICCMPWLAASFGFGAMLTLGLIIAIPSLMLTIASVLHIFHKRGWAKLIGNIALGAMALAALVIGILLLAAPGLPVISAFAGIIGGLGSMGALLTKIALIAVGACKVLDVGWDFKLGSLLRVLYGAIGNDVHKLDEFGKTAIKKILLAAFYNLPKVIRNLAIIALAIVVCCKISLAVGLVFAIPFALKFVANLFDRTGKRRAHKVAKFLDNSVRGIFGLALGYIGISFLHPAVLVGFLGKLSFVAAAFPGPIALVAGISLIIFGALTLFKTVVDVICGDEEKLRQGYYEMSTGVSKSAKNTNLSLRFLGFLDFKSVSNNIDAIIPGLAAQYDKFETDLLNLEAASETVSELSEKEMKNQD